jgi:Glycosyl transferase family 11
MIIVKISGGLGNQMFQYALALKFYYQGIETKLDTLKYEYYQVHNNFELNRVFCKTLPIATKQEVANLGYLKDNRIIRWLIKTPFKKKSIYVENGLGFHKEVLNKNKGYIWGYWQNENYFIDIETRIREAFVFPELDTDPLKRVAEKINKTNSVSIHIRRGDYLEHPLYKGICNIDYYEKSIKYISNSLENLEFFIFSNDMEWVKKNLNYPNVNFIDFNYGLDSYRDMQLMSMCKHNIIANSSFSWWGAWLNVNENKIVIGPRQWTNKKNDGSEEIIPNGWIRI